MKRVMRDVGARCLAAILGSALASCSLTAAPEIAVPPLRATPVVANPTIDIAKTQFRAGDYGLAEASFRRAITENPESPEAWLGLAASHDELRRFDLADVDYRHAGRRWGETAALLNNRGFSYLLRGNYAQARSDLARAAKLDPGNSYILSNLAELRWRTSPGSN